MSKSASGASVAFDINYIQQRRGTNSHAMWGASQTGSFQTGASPGSYLKVSYMRHVNLHVIEELLRSHPSSDLAFHPSCYVVNFSWLASCNHPGSEGHT